MANIYDYLKNHFLKISNLERNNEIFVFLIVFILLAIPLKYNVGTLSVILFVLVSFIKFRVYNFSYNKTLLLPIAFYGFMVLSLLWTYDFRLSVAGLQKEIIFLFVPMAFLVMPKLSKEQRTSVIKIYSFGMVLFCVFYLLKAVFKYFSTGDGAVFFYHELVTLDVNAIYISVLVSFALFYFIDVRNKNNFTRICIGFLAMMVFLLASKSIIFVDFILIIGYYSFYSNVPKSVRYLTVTVFTAFLIFSLFFVKEVRERFLLEYETAFIDNTINDKIGNTTDTVYNVSIHQAWNDGKFEDNQFFPGTALRVYQFRIFNELILEKSVFFTGFGLEASQEQIQEKAEEYELYDGYGDFNFHNQYTQTFAELGFFGFLLLIAMVVLSLKKAIQTKDFLHITFAITMIVLFLTESFFCRQRGITFFVVLYCFFNSNFPKIASGNLNSI
jgi:O-antigen ligase